jgi:hypothetical protein
MSSLLAATSDSGVGYFSISSKKTGIACLPCVRMRNVTAMRRRKGSSASFSWMSPNVGEESGGKGMQEIGPPGVRGRLGVNLEGEPSLGVLGVCGWESESSSMTTSTGVPAFSPLTGLALDALDGVAAGEK